MPRRERDYVFGYGSLLTNRDVPLRRSEARPVRLNGYRRRWDVAMDNRVTIPGYKYYLDAATGERPAVFVTFLNVRAAEGAWVTGTVFAATRTMLDALDRRERNYRRHDVTECVDGPLRGRVWTYIGTREAQARYDTGVAAGCAVVSQPYYERVRGSFERFGPEALSEFDETTDELEVPLRVLRRVDVPEVSAARRWSSPAAPAR